MAHYRDDVISTLVFTDRAVAAFRSIVSETLRPREGGEAGLQFNAVDTLVTSNVVALGPTFSRTADQARVAELLGTHFAGAGLSAETLRAREFRTALFGARSSGTAVAGDEAFGTPGARTSDRARAGDTAGGAKHAGARASDRARTKDLSIQVAHARVIDSTGVADTSRSRGRYRAQAASALVLSEELLARVRAKSKTVDRQRAADSTQAHLQALSRSEELVTVLDAPRAQFMTEGIAWTANSVNWAHSQYDNFGYGGVFVKAGRLYATAPSGVFAAAAGELITARLTTRLVDSAGDSNTLAHPTHSYLEYAKDGTLAVSVLQRQLGALEEYSYDLPQELAGVLTNGRVRFGRGLRGRYFQFKLKFEGTTCRIDDFSIYTAATQRRI